MSQQTSAVDAIKARYKAWMEAIRTKDLDTIVDMYADDATYMPPGRKPVAGKAAVRVNWAGYLQRDSFEAEYTPTIQVSHGGDMAFDIGHYVISMKKEGKPVTFVGKYVVVWKLIDGQWKAAVDIDNDNGPIT
jgi:ketosteroid isomerase-like protein